MLPASTHLDRSSTPNAGGSIEVEKSARAVSNGLFDDEMAVKHDGLQASQQVIRPVDMRPAHLRTADERVAEVIYKFSQTVRFGHKIGVKNRQELAFGSLKSIFKGAGLKPCSVGSMYILNIEALGCVIF